MEDEAFIDIIHKINPSRKGRNDFLNSELQPSNSDTNFVIKREKEKRNITENILKSKRNNHNTKILHNHKHTSNCKNCHSFNKLLKKDKNDLYIYIENNLKYLKLFGNQRYNKNSPSLFIEDYKKRLPQKKMGLVPIPAKKNKEKFVNNYNKLYNLQRSIVMVRRYQYGRKNFSPAPTLKGTYDISLIQRWWKKMSKIIIIQKNFRGYFIRKQVESILNLHRFMDNFENILINLMVKNSFDKIYLITVISKKRKAKKGYYISKNRFILTRKILKKIIIIQNNARILISKMRYKRLLREQKFTIVNKYGFVSKINYSLNEIFDKIIRIQFKIKKYLRDKYFIERKIIHKDFGINYIDKNYINDYSKRIINFNKLMKHALQILSIKKIKCKYKKIEEYNEEDINKVIFIQKNYLKYYFNKNKNIKKRIYIKKIKKFYSIDKFRLKDNIKEIILIQKIYRLYNLNKNKFKKDLIRNKPISSSIKIIKEKENSKFFIFYNKNLYNKANFKNKGKNIEYSNEKNINNSNDKLINNICFISKEKKKNVLNEVLFLQTKIFSYLFLKHIKEKRIIRIINKNNYNKGFIFTKNFTNVNYCIIKLKKIQNLYKKEYKYLKNNIIEYNNTKNNNDNKESNTNRNNMYINAIPKKKKDIKKFIFPPKRNKNNNEIIDSKNKNKIEYPKINKIININNFPNNKYYTKYNKDYIPYDKNRKKNIISLSQIKDKKSIGLFKEFKSSNNNKITLRELLRKNKTPIKELKGNYISKKRVEKKKYDNYLNYNLKLYKIAKFPIYITKKRYFNNDYQIKLIQKFWRNNSDINIIKKPLANILEKEDIKEKNEGKDRINNLEKNNIYNFSPKKRNRLPLIELNSNRELYNNSKFKHFMLNIYTNDEYFKNKNNSNYKNNINKRVNKNNVNNYSLNNNINNNKNNSLENNILLNIANYYYITKIRKINILKYILLLQKVFRNKINNKKYLKIINCQGLILNKMRINAIAHNKYLKEINESKIIMKIPNKFKENKITKLSCHIKINKQKCSNKNNISNKFNEINNEIIYISKARHINYISYIEKIQKNWRIKNKNKIINKRIRTKGCIITINRMKENIKKILKIQKIFRERIFKKNEEKYKIFSRKAIFKPINKINKKYNININNNIEKRNYKDKIIINNLKSNQKNKIIIPKIKDNQNMINQISNLSLYNFKNRNKNNIIKKKK